LDFKRIEWIFFLAFLGVNIFLFNIYREASAEQNIQSRSNQKVSIEKRLKSEDIKVEGELSDEQLQGYYLSGQPTNMVEALKNERTRIHNPKFLSERTSLEETVLNHRLSGDFYISNPKQIGASISNYLNQGSNVIFGQEYSYVPEWSKQEGTRHYIYAAQQYEGIPINDDSSRLVMTLENKKDLLELTYYSQTHISQLTPLREAMRLYSEEDAVNTLYVNNKIPADATLKWRQLAYTLILDVRGKNVYVPAWFVAVETEDAGVQIESVNAFTNRVITNNTVQSVENT